MDKGMKNAASDLCKGGVYQIKNGKVVSSLDRGSIVDCREDSPDYGKTVDHSGLERN